MLYKHAALYVTPVMVGISLLEAWLVSRSSPQTFAWREIGLSLLDMTGRKLLGLLPLAWVTPIFLWIWQHRVYTMHLNGIAAFFALFIGQEFCYYWYHRAAHRIRFYWATHAVHHSPNLLLLSTSYRLGWTEKLTGAGIFFAPLVWLGVRPEVVIVTVMLNLWYQFWIHTTWIPRLGWLEYVFNTPSAHRVHHASNLVYLDANYGGVLIVFDRLFGTYVAERKDEPCRYGLVTPVHTRNPLKLEFQQWIGLARDMRSAATPWTAVQYLLRPPGWQPDGEGETTEALRRRAARMSNAGCGSAPVL